MHWRTHVPGRGGLRKHMDKYGTFQDKQRLRLPVLRPTQVATLPAAQRLRAARPGIDFPLAQCAA